MIVSLSVCMPVCMHMCACVFVCLMSVSAVGMCGAIVPVCHDKKPEYNFLESVFFFPSILVFARASLVHFVPILNITG